MLCLNSSSPQRVSWMQTPLQSAPILHAEKSSSSFWAPAPEKPGHLPQSLLYQSVKPVTRWMTSPTSCAAHALSNKLPAALSLQGTKHPWEKHLRSLGPPSAVLLLSTTLCRVEPGPPRYTTRLEASDSAVSLYSPAHITLSRGNKEARMLQRLSSFSSLFSDNFIISVAGFDVTQQTAHAGKMWISLSFSSPLKAL